MTRGRLEVAIVSKAIKMAGRGNMHIDTRVIKVAGFKSEVKLDCQGCLGHQNLNLNFPWPFSTEVYRAIALLFVFKSEGEPGRP